MSRFITEQKLPKFNYSGGETSWADLDEARKSTEGIQIPKFNKIAAAIRKIIHPLLLNTMILDRKARGLKLQIENEGEFTPPGGGRPVLFAANHTNVHDMPYAAEVVREHFYVMAAVDGHTPFTRALFNANGVSHWMERGGSARAKASRAIGLLTAIQTLRHGVNMLVYPEATWNQYYQPELLGYWGGAVLTAHYGGARIVPLVFEYTDKVCYVNRGRTFETDDFSGPNSANKALRDAMLETKKSMRARYGVTEEEWRRLRRRWLSECSAIDPEYEKSAILRAPGIGLPPELFNTERR